MSESFSELLNQDLRLKPEQRAQLQAYYDAVLAENQLQNLTRITSPVHFYEENMGDAQILAQSRLNGVVYDLGSGAGLPGIPLAILRPDLNLVLGEAEKSKADFLLRAIHQLGLPGVSVSSERAEVFLKKTPVNAVVSRAVGPISRIWGWIGECSTWNDLYLLKGPGWSREWSAPESKKARARLDVVQITDYQVGRDVQKTRCLVHLRKRAQ